MNWINLLVTICLFSSIQVFGQDQIKTEKGTVFKAVRPEAINSNDSIKEEFILNRKNLKKSETLNQQITKSANEAQSQITDNSNEKQGRKGKHKRDQDVGSGDEVGRGTAKRGSNLSGAAVNSDGLLIKPQKRKGSN